jgi:hypothetical protein
MHQMVKISINTLRFSKKRESLECSIIEAKRHKFDEETVKLLFLIKLMHLIGVKHFITPKKSSFRYIQAMCQRTCLKFKGEEPAEFQFWTKKDGQRDPSATYLSQQELKCFHHLW